jgi:hypothetical protein
MTPCAAKCAACWLLPHCRGHRLGQPGRERRPAGRVHGLLADLVDGATDDVIDRGGVHAGAVDQRTQRVREQLDGVLPVERAARLPLADRRPDRIDDDRVSHD